MKQRLEIAVHIALQIIAIAGLLIYATHTTRAQYCSDNLNPCQGEACTTHVSTCENNPCAPGDCSNNSYCCVTSWGLCTEDGLGCQRKRCCDGQNNQFCEDGYCRWLP